jgi:hypothetical protein
VLEGNRREQTEVEKTWVKETYNNKGKIVIDELTFAIKIQTLVKHIRRYNTSQ